MTAKARKIILRSIAGTLLTFILPNLAGFALTAYWRNVTISPATTHITAPLQPSGAPDYLLFLNEAAAQGVTPQNNAAGPLVLASGLTGTSEYVVAIEKTLDITSPGQLEGFSRWREKQALATQPAGTYLTRAQESELADELDHAAKAPWTEKDWPEVAAYIKLSEPRLTLMHEAARRDRCYLPLLTSGGSAKSDSPAPLFSRYRLLNVGEMRSLSKLLRARAMLHVRAGDHASAMKDVQAIRRVADHCAQTPDVITWLVALAMDAEGLQAARAAMSDADLDERTLMAWNDLCKPRPLAPPPCLLNHRFEMLDQWCTLAREGPKGFGSSSEPESNPAKYYVLPVHYDAWLRVANTYHDELLKAWTMSNVHDAVAAMDAAFDVYAQSKSVWPWINMLHGLGSAAQASRWRMLDEQNRVEAHLNLTAIALKRHRLAHGAYPNDLAALTPNYLPAAPADAFAPGSELKYRREGSGFILYSVGREGIDDNGQPREPERPRKTFDLVVQANR